MKFLATGFYLSAFLAATLSAAAQAVHITELDDRLRIEINGKLFSEYHFTNAPRPYFYPLLGPAEAPMTRTWPMEAGVGEEHDHPHHRSLWYAHSSVDGVDFWTDIQTNNTFVSKAGAKIVHRKFTAVQSGDQFGVISSTDDWVTKDGAIVCTDERTMKIYARPDNERLFDFEITLHAPADKPVVFGDDKDGAIAVRVADSMRLKRADKKPGEGHIVLSTGARDNATWGKRADWCDYFGPVNGKTVGIAIFDHPSNPRHPTWWHVRDYGLFAANPWGIHHFENKPAGTGDMTVAAGQSITFRYRFYLHEGDDTQAKVAEHYKEYCQP
ncbi:MAG TPA: PmoA family protein [Verrucomicrobiae bacterium]|jgi:hypothetical protein|nr:PmoA family protein [Verrucomicrobiae bacterium]